MFITPKAVFLTYPIHGIYSKATCCQLFSKVQIPSAGNAGSMLLNNAFEYKGSTYNTSQIVTKEDSAWFPNLCSFRPCMMTKMPLK